MTAPASSRRHDACVVGSGAGGAVAAAELASAGLDVLLIEQGRHEPPGADLRQLIPGFETARARDPDGRWVEHGYPWTACCVGGGTRFYAGVSLRLRRVDFAASAHTAVDALDPTWPYGYDELDAHYEWAERRLGVSTDGGLDPTAPAGPVGVLPAQRLSVRGRALAGAAGSLGLRPFPMPLAVSTEAFGGAPACADLTTCTDRVCPHGAKGDVWVRLLAELEPLPQLTLRTRLKAVQLVETAPGRVDRLDCLDLDTGQLVTVIADVFVVAANAVQTSALLLRSTSAHSPDGLGNGSGLVGRALCMKVSQNLTGRLRRPLPQPAPAGGGRFVTVGVSDYYQTDACPSGLGGMIFETGPLRPAEIADPHVLRLECLLADQPLASNRVLLDPAAPDRYGLARVVMDYRPHRLDLRRLAFLRERAVELLRAAGAERVVAEPIDYTLGSAHLHGTCRMGTDPRTSVCAPDGRVHETENVYVADGSLLPYPGAVNPTLTIQAVAHRVAVGLLEQCR